MRVPISPHPHQHLTLSVFLIITILVDVTEKAMAPYSSTLAWKIPWTQEPWGAFMQLKLQSMGLLRVGHDWATSLPLFTFMHWRRKWHPTPVLLPGKSNGRRSHGCIHAARGAFMQLRLQSMGSLRVGHDWATSLSLFTFMHWRRKWQPTPVFLPGESQGWGSLLGCRLWGRTESDTTEET